MTWTKKSIPAVIPQGLDTLASETSALLSTISPVLDTTIEALNLAGAFIGSDQDPLQAIAIPVLNELRNFNNDLFGSGVFQLTINPYNLFTENDPTGLASNELMRPFLPNFDKTLGIRRKDQFGWPLISPKKVIQLMQQSLDDEGDTRRPQFSDSAEVAGFGFILTAPSLTEIQLLLESFNQIIETKELVKLYERTKRLLSQPPTDPEETTVRSKLPDWSSYQFNNWATLADIQKQVNKYINYFEGLLVSSDQALDKLSKILLRKVEDLRTLIEDLNTLLSNLAAASAASGIYFLDIPKSIGGNSYIKTQMESEELSKLKGNEYSIGLVFIGGGPSLTPISNIRDLLV